MSFEGGEMEHPKTMAFGSPVGGGDNGPTRPLSSSPKETAPVAHELILEELEKQHPELSVVKTNRNFFSRPGSMPNNLAPLDNLGLNGTIAEFEVSLRSTLAREAIRYDDVINDGPPEAAVGGGEHKTHKIMFGRLNFYTEFEKGRRKYGSVIFIYTTDKQKINNPATEISLIGAKLSIVRAGTGDPDADQKDIEKYAFEFTKEEEANFAKAALEKIAERIK